MYQFTSYGSPVTSVEGSDITPVDPSDVRYLGLWVQAARAADEESFCPEYDRLAENLGAPTREDLRQAGLLDSEFTVEGTRTVTVTFRVPFTSTYTAARPGDVRRNFDADELGDFDVYSIREAAHGDWDVDSDDIEVDSVERQ